MKQIALKRLDVGNIKYEVCYMHNNLFIGFIFFDSFFSRREKEYILVNYLSLKSEYETDNSI